MVATEGSSQERIFRPCHTDAYASIVVARSRPFTSDALFVFLLRSRDICSLDVAVARSYRYQYEISAGVASFGLGRSSFLRTACHRTVPRRHFLHSSRQNRRHFLQRSLSQRLSASSWRRWFPSPAPPFGPHRRRLLALLVLSRLRLRL